MQQTPLRICRIGAADGTIRLGIVRDDAVVPIDSPDAPWKTLAELLAWSVGRADTGQVLLDATRERAAIASWSELNTGATSAGLRLLAPLDRQEVWAAGVTYLRSRQAREDESQGSGIYDRVYDAERPELFFKATPARVSGPHEPIRIRMDARWNVPEPELALVLNPALEIVGYTIGNDVSSRDIEGENPLYLPQAKVYRQCCALGPAITLAATLPHANDTRIRAEIQRGAAKVWDDEIRTSQMKRTFSEMIAYLGRDNVFPEGVILLTGTGIVPSNEVTLMPGDIVRISIDGIGMLQNSVVQG